MASASVFKVNFASPSGVFEKQYVQKIDGRNLYKVRNTLIKSPFLSGPLRHSPKLQNWDRRVNSQRISIKCYSGVEFENLQYVLAVGFGLPCTVMECGDVIYRSTLPPGDPFKLTVAGVTLAILAAAYLWATPGVAPGFWDMFVLGPLESILRPKLTKVEFTPNFPLYTSFY